MNVPEDLDWACPLAHYRMTRGLSLRQWGRQRGVSVSTLARTRRGDGQPETHTVLRLRRWRDPTQVSPPCACCRCVAPARDRLAELDARVAHLEAVVACRMETRAL